MPSNSNAVGRIAFTTRRILKKMFLAVLVITVGFILLISGIVYAFVH